jgi:hypothetical protein
MADIVGNALGYDQPPSPGDLSERLAAMSLRDLLDQDINAPMPAFNGADDIHVPQQDMFGKTYRALPGSIAELSASRFRDASRQIESSPCPRLPPDGR